MNLSQPKYFKQLLFGLIAVVVAYFFAEPIAQRLDAQPPAAPIREAARDAFNPQVPADPNSPRFDAFINDTLKVSDPDTRYDGNQHRGTEVRTRIIPFLDPSTGETKYRQETYTLPPGFNTLPTDPQAADDEQWRAMKLSAELRDNKSKRLGMTADDFETKTKQLRELVNTQFEKRHAAQAEQLKNIEKQAEQLRLTLDKRLAAKDQIVDRRIEQLLGEPDPLAWQNAPPPLPAAMFGIANDTATPQTRTSPEPRNYWVGQPLSYQTPFASRSPTFGLAQSAGNATRQEALNGLRSERRTDPTLGNSDREVDARDNQPKPGIGFMASPDSREQPIAMTIDRLLRQRLELDQATSELIRSEQLRAKGLISQSQLEKANLAVATLKASNEVLFTQIDQAQKLAEFRVKEATKTVEGLKVNQRDIDDPQYLRRVVEANQQLAYAKFDANALERLIALMDSRTKASEKASVKESEESPGKPQGPTS